MTTFPRWPLAGDDELPVPEANIDDEPQRCIRLNAEWLTYVVGAVEQLANYKRYNLTTQEEIDHVYDNFQHLMERLVAEKECVEPVTYALQLVTVGDWRPQNTAGGSTVVTAWTTLPYNAMIYDGTGGASVSGNAIFLPAGTWRVHAEHQISCDAAMFGQIRMNNGGVFTYGTHDRFLIDETKVLTVDGVALLPSGGAISFEYYVTNAFPTGGLGRIMNLAGQDEKYGHVVCERLHQTSP